MAVAVAQPVDAPLDQGLGICAEALRRRLQMGLEVDRGGALCVQRADDLGGLLSVRLDGWHGGLLSIWRVGSGERRVGLAV